MSHCTDSATGFENLPVDILYIIAEKIVNKTDLLSLRLASHRFDDVFVSYVYQILAREVRLGWSMHLHRAAAICYDLVIQRLLNTDISLNCRDKVGETALHVAVRNNCFVSVRRLLQGGAIVDVKSYHEWTPLHLAARYGRVAILRELVGAGANVDVRGFHGWTALHYAAKSGYLEIIEVLLNAGADTGALDNDMRTAAQEATRFGYYEVLRVLEE